MSDFLITEAMAMVGAERERQIVEEGYTAEHDDGHDDGELAYLAAAYAISSRGKSDIGNSIPRALKNRAKFLRFDFKPADPIRDLTRAGALILAELERRLRIEAKEMGV